MKKVLMVLMALVICFGFVGCGNNVTADALNKNSKCRMVGIGSTLLAYDEETKVIYIRNYADYSSIYTPYFNEEGKAVMYDGQEIYCSFETIDGSLIYDKYTNIVYIDNSTFSEQNRIAAPYYNADGSLCRYDEESQEILSLQ